MNIHEIVSSGGFEQNGQAYTFTEHSTANPRKNLLKLKLQDGTVIEETYRPMFRSARKVLDKMIRYQRIRK